MKMTPPGQKQPEVPVPESKVAMNLDRVTMTGADDSTLPTDLVHVSKAYPFVEWGILVSETQMGVTPRFPGESWIRHVQTLVPPLTLSLHICGRWVRKLLLGQDEIPRYLLAYFDRVQLNFHAENTPCNPEAFAKALKSFGGRQIIFQIDGAGGNKHFEAVANDADCVTLFDISGGAGILPDDWPKPELVKGDSALRYHGYAGGLGPDNLAEQIPLIAKAAGNCRVWIDMETRVRSSSRFDLSKVVECLGIAEPFIS